jgi:hypothetical protein
MGKQNTQFPYLFSWWSFQVRLLSHESLYVDVKYIEWTENLST